MPTGVTPPPSSASAALRRGSGLAGVFLLTFLLVLLSIALAREVGNVAFIWLPNAFVFAVMINVPVREWKWLLLLMTLANLAGNLTVGDGLGVAAGLAIANVSEVMVGAVLVRRWVLHQPGLTMRGFAHALLIYALLAIPLGALIGAEVIHQAYATPRLGVLQNWWLGSTIGFLMLAVPGLLLLRTDLHSLKRPIAVLDFLLTLLILVVVNYLLLLFIPFPFIYMYAVLTAIAYRDGALRTIVHANLVVLLLGTLWWCELIDLSPLLLGSGPKGLWAAAGLSSLFPALLGMAVEDMRRQQNEVNELTGRLRLASGALRLGTWDWHVGTGELYWDEQMFALYDLSPDSEPLTVEEWRPRVHPDDLANAEAALQAALTGERDYDAEFRILTLTGSIRYIRAAGVVLTDATGQQRFVGVNWDVTPERQALQAMRDAQIRLNGVINAASEFSIIATSTDGTIEVFSEGSERMLGYRAEELVRRATPAALHVIDEVIARGIELSVEYDRPIEGFDVFVEKARHGESETREWTYVRKDGTRLPVKVVVTAIRDSQHQITGFLGIAQDISSQRKAQQAMISTNRVLEHQISVAQRARLEFENLFELAPGALLVVDKQGSIIKANTQSHDLFGYDYGDLVGRSIEELIPRESRNAHVARRNEFMRNPSPRLMATDRVLSGMKKSGEQFLAEITLSPLLINGAPCTIAIARDVSLQKKTEKDLARAKEEAEAASKAKSDFLANMSHEIRTPLNAILGTAQLLDKTKLSEESQRYIKMIRTSGVSLLGVINDVLDFSKIEAGKMELSHEPFELEDILNTVANLMSINVGEKEIEPAIGIAPGTPQRWIGDALRLNQILVNLVGNAIKFTENGEVVVQLELQRREGDTGILKCSVRDTGIGMNVQQQQRLFQAFSQADTSMTRRFGGTGLGLVICQRLIHMMGGDIQLTSMTGVGSEFQFTVQLDIAAEQPAAPGTLTTALATAPRRILVVDNNKVSRTILTRTLKQWGWQVTAQDNCQSAEQQLRDEQPFDAILVDWKLPGHARLRQHRTEQQDAAGARHILMVSAYGRRHHNINLEQWDSVLIKPITASTLHRALAAERQHGALDTAEGSPSATVLANVRMLLVEDNELNQVVACGLLEQAGALIDVVENGQQAVEWLRKRPEHYQLVLMDVQMPVMDGFTATRLIRDELKLTLPIIAMSAGVMLAEQEQCLASGMNGFIAKPIDYQRMLDTILQHLPLAGAPARATPVSTNQATEHAVDLYFSPDKMLSFVRGKPKRLRDVISMIETMIARGVTPIAEGHTLLLQGSKADAARYFHTMKGSMGNLGAQHMWDAAQALEQAIKKDELENLDSLLEAATECLQKTVDAARLWLQQHPEYSEQVQDAQPLTADALQQLRTLLTENNIQACDLYDALRPALAATLTSDAAAALQNAMQALDFSAAIKLLDTMSL